MTFKCTPLDVYFHMSNHYKKLKTVKSVVDTSAPPGYSEFVHRKGRSHSRSERYKQVTTSKISARNVDELAKDYNFDKENVPCNKLNRSHSLPVRPPTRRRSNEETKNKKKYVFRARSNGPSSIDIQTINPNPKPFLSTRSYGYESTTDSVYTILSPTTRTNPEIDVNVSEISSRLNERPIPTPRQRQSKINSHRSFITEHEYLQFMLRITEDIIRNDVYTTEDILRIFNSHLEANRGRLDQAKMAEKIQMLSKELNMPSQPSPDQNSSNKEHIHNTKATLKKALNCTCESKPKPISLSTKTCECHSVRRCPLKCALHLDEIQNVQQNSLNDKEVNQSNSPQGAIEDYIKISEEQQCDYQSGNDAVIKPNQNVVKSSSVTSTMPKESTSSCRTTSTSCEFDKDSLETLKSNPEKHPIQTSVITEETSSSITNYGSNKIGDKNGAQCPRNQEEHISWLDEIDETNNNFNSQQEKPKIRNLETTSCQTSEDLLTVVPNVKTTQLPNIQVLESNNNNKDEFILISGPIYIPKNYIFLNNPQISQCLDTQEPIKNMEEVLKLSHCCKVQKKNKVATKSEEKSVNCATSVKKDCECSKKVKTNAEDGYSSISTLEPTLATYSKIHEAALNTIHSPSAVVQNPKKNPEFPITESNFLNEDVLAKLQGEPTVIKNMDVKRCKHKSKSTALDKLNEYDLTPQRDNNRVCNCKFQEKKCTHYKTAQNAHNQRLLLGDEYEINNIDYCNANVGVSDRIKLFYPDVATQTISADWLLPRTPIQNSKDNKELENIICTYENKAIQTSTSLTKTEHTKPIIIEKKIEPIPPPIIVEQIEEILPSILSNKMELSQPPSITNQMEAARPSIISKKTVSSSIDSDKIEDTIKTERKATLKRVTVEKGSEDSLSLIRQKFTIIPESEDSSPDSTTDLRGKSKNLYETRKSPSKRSSDAFSKVALQSIMPQTNDNNDKIQPTESIEEEEYEVYPYIESQSSDRRLMPTEDNNSNYSQADAVVTCCGIKRKNKDKDHHFITEKSYPNYQSTSPQRSDTISEADRDNRKSLRFEYSLTSEENKSTEERKGEPHQVKPIRSEIDVKTSYDSRIVDRENYVYDILEAKEFNTSDESVCFNGNEFDSNRASGTTDRV